MFDLVLWPQKHTGWKPSISTIGRRAKELNLEFGLRCLKLKKYAIIKNRQFSPLPTVLFMRC